MSTPATAVMPLLCCCCISRARSSNSGGELVHSGIVSAREKNRQAQRRFRERQKSLITDLKDKVSGLEKKVCRWQSLIDKCNNGRAAITCCSRASTSSCCIMSVLFHALVVHHRQSCGSGCMPDQQHCHCQVPPSHVPTLLMCHDVRWMISHVRLPC